MLRIKGSGSDLATIEARHFPGLRLDELLPLREREAMSDEEMVAYLARCLVEPDAPRPSIETLLHAFLPAAHVDHVHADAICALANAPDPEAAVHEVLGDDVAVVPYLRPGFELSKRVADLAGARAVVLAHHGLVTWGETHEESYGLTLELVGARRASTSARRGGDARGQPPPDGSQAASSSCARLRGRLSRERRQVLVVDRGQRVLADRADVDAIAAVRSTPDHMLRIGSRTCVLDLDGDVDARSSVRDEPALYERHASAGAAIDPRRGSCSCPASAASRPRRTRARPACGSRSPRTRTRAVGRDARRASAPRAGSTSARSSSSSTGRSSSTS